jgi:hypothetical protein
MIASTLVAASLDFEIPFCPLSLMTHSSWYLRFRLALIPFLAIPSSPLGQLLFSRFVIAVFREIVTQFARRW